MYEEKIVDKTEKRANKKSAGTRKITDYLRDVENS